MILAIVALCNVLLFVWTFQARLCLAGAKDGRVHQFPKGSRLILSFSIVLANFVIWCLELYTVHKLLIFTGMLFSFAGDLSMAGLLPWRNRLIGGMMTFGVAHCSYMAAFIAAAHANGTTVFNVCLLAAFCGYTGMLFFMWRAFIRNPKKTDLINRGGVVIWASGRRNGKFCAWRGKCSAVRLGLCSDRRVVVRHIRRGCGGSKYRGTFNQK